ncbi:hypothetical protein [Planomonospora venezuelensis]|uniref:hypothetical protein n=1 Tax=Planomonospora venezuelensis TaxID=1999 RepID=UPI0031EFDB4D
MPTPRGAHALVRRSREGRVPRALRRSGALSRGETAVRVGLRVGARACLPAPEGV